ncbi:sulfurtransferase-like selenium metabolism protein YedF [Dendrosporobacter sp. 1207_IL3150]|uniref:sulfurtransferase-like selenium metabolism protein YedF n=1 Tax=Dendrosporobacter sp. 1207_IL3150 TaxID=3084054 RepID=UPI002FDB8AB5
MSINIDARGLACPQPVIAAKKALDSVSDGQVIVIVDNLVAKENVQKLALANKCEVNIDQQGEHYYISIAKGNASDVPAPLNKEKLTETVYLFTKNTLGQGKDELGAVLIKAFMYTLIERKPYPKTIMFINSAVLLTVSDSPVIEHLMQLEKAGVEILSCGTCLDYYQLKDKLSVGSVTNMYTILDELSAASKAITL